MAEVYRSIGSRGRAVPTRACICTHSIAVVLTRALGDGELHLVHQTRDPWAIHVPDHPDSSRRVVTLAGRDDSD